MTFDEAFLPGTSTLPFYARLYHNRVEPCIRQPLVHTHPTLEISCFPDNEAVCQMNDKKIHINAGDLIIFRSNEQHYFTELYSDHTITTTGLQFFPEFFWACSDNSFDVKYRQVFSDKNNHFINLIDQKNENSPRIKQLFNNIITEFKNKDENYALMIKLNLISLLLLVIRAYSPDMLNDVSNNAEIDVSNISHIQTAMKYINEHLTEELKLKQLSEIANMSPSYFSMLFKELNGFSTWDYIVSKRIEKAKMMLSTTDLPVYIISEQCGFNNTTNFYKAFRKLNSVSPNEYRK